MNDNVEEYRQLSIEIEATNYEDTKSVRKRNKNVNKMYALINSLKDNEVSSFLELLDDPIPAKQTKTAVITTKRQADIIIITSRTRHMQPVFALSSLPSWFYRFLQLVR